MAKLYIKGKFTSENKYCIYNLAVQKELKSAPKTFDENYIQSLIADESYQVIVVYLSGLLDFNENIDKLEQINHYLAFSYYKLGDIKKSLEINQLILLKNPADYHALHGIALAYYAQGDIEKAIETLNACIQEYGMQEAYKDLYRILLQQNMNKEVDILLQRASKANVNI